MPSPKWVTPPLLLTKLGEVDAQIAAVERKIEESKPRDLKATVEQMRNFVYRNAMQLLSLMSEGATKAKAVLAQHIGELKLTRKETQNGLQYEVSGAVNEKYVMPMVECVPNTPMGLPRYCRPGRSELPCWYGRHEGDYNQTPGSYRPTTQGAGAPERTQRRGAHSRPYRGSAS
jgi:hypothetical protein